MAGFHLVRAGGGATARALVAAEQRFRSHGFTDFTPFDAGPYRGFHVGYICGGPETFASFADGDFIAVAGTLVYRGRVGAEALRLLYADWRFPFDDWQNLAGQFALLVRKSGRLSLITDFFAAFQLFHDPDWRVVSTSFLATAESRPRLRWHDQGLYEFAFNVFPIGDDTVFEDVRRLGPSLQVELADPPVFRRVVKQLPGDPEPMPIEDRIVRNAERLAETIRPYAEHWGDRMQVPLSGGLDSRLALAALRAAGVKPHVYVYGDPGDIDVEIARRMGAAEGFAVEHFDKRSHATVTPDAFAGVVERNWEETDALTTDGGLFDNGGNRAARYMRQAGGQLAVSGGCGEVYRNFFYLPDRRTRLRAVALTFFARFHLPDVTERFDRRRFISAIEAKLADSLYAPIDRRLERTEVEQLYPRVRCRSFFGREISLVGRHGAYLMPFLNRRVVAEALRVPMDLKTAGRFEAMLLNRIDPALARHQSAYGHSFAEPPNLDHRLSELSTTIRPAWLRQRSYSVRRRLGPLFDDHGGILAPQYLGRVIDLHFPHMSAFFRPSNIADQGLYRRVATLELLGEKLADRLVA
ncbi:MAG: hypothetical protein RQ833_09825 [Sphingomonadaceae bacterium]|nr:hypothetical protein [Sphingomonadaceae bacterium]